MGFPDPEITTNNNNRSVTHNDPNNKNINLKRTNEHNKPTKLHTNYTQVNGKKRGKKNKNKEILLISFGPILGNKYGGATEKNSRKVSFVVQTSSEIIKPDSTQNKRTTFSTKTSNGIKLKKLEKCPKIISLF